MNPRGTKNYLWNYRWNLMKIVVYVECYLSHKVPFNSDNRQIGNNVTDLWERQIRKGRFLFHLVWFTAITVNFTVKSPPIFSPEEKGDYISWKNDIAIWELFINIKDEKVREPVNLAQGKASEIVRNLKPEDVGKKERHGLIIAKLDAVYLQDEASHAFHTL